ncbi:MAG TPA: hypothetical protein P5052_00405 [Candidatus Paceibacterota bacterium]|jgi:predicted oxidoreductase|nr:hypothetical protein [Candidatus Paceibacterota bacterium]HRZ29267.1 hypothetical protein [Candidatus Paceibacterota bacterium]
MDIVSDSFKEKIDKFYGAQAQDKYQEAQYMQVLIDTQRQLDLKNQQPKSKDQIKLILAELNNIQAGINQNNLSLGPKFNVFHDKFEQEALIYKNNLTELVSRMNNRSPSVQLSSAGLDKAIDELKLEIANSLNE